MEEQVKIGDVILEEGSYYRINGTKTKVLAWESGKWFKPKKDVRGQYGTWLMRLDVQPTNIKKVEKVNINELS